MFLQPLLKQRWHLLWIPCVPLAFAWAFLTWLRRENKLGRPYRAKLPVICVGNLHAGGTGKTPTVLALAGYLSSRNPAIVSRGFKGRATKSGAKLDRNHLEGSAEYGDEPWMISRFSKADIFVGRDRVRSLKQIEKANAYGLAISDDGFQNFSFAKDVSLICLPTNLSPEENFCLPAGMLREPLAALEFAQAALLPEGSFHSQWQKLLSEAFPGLAIFSLSKESLGLWSETKQVNAAATDRFGAFCGIANPERFVQEVESLPNGVFLKSFSDHHAYTQADVETVLEKGQSLGVTQYLTTEKDYAKAQPFFLAKGISLWTSRYRYKLPQSFQVFLDEKLKGVA